MNICPDIALINKVLTNQELRVVCFTNGMTFRTGGLQVTKSGQVETKNVDALSLFLRASQNLGFNIEMRCLPHFEWTPIIELTTLQKRTKLIFELRFTKSSQCDNPLFTDFKEKILTVITPFSPAAHGRIESHPIIVSLKSNLGIQTSAPRLLSSIYSKFRNDTYNDLYQYNIN
jgi:hypothetical protein